MAPKPYVLYPNVRMAAGAVIGPYAAIGEPPAGKAPGEVETVIGAHAVIRSHAVIYAGNTIGDGFQTGHGVMIREYNRIGDHVSIGTHSIIEHHVVIGHRVRIHSGVFIPEFSVLEADAWIGPKVVLTNARYPKSRNAKKNLKGPRIRTGAIVGANTTILPGVVIGRHCLVGAGSLVTGDVPDHKLAVGHPARVVGDVREIEAYHNP